MLQRPVRLVVVLAALQAAASPNFRQEVQSTDLGFSVTEELSAALDSGRGLQVSGNKCYFSLLNVFERAAMDQWMTCINEKVKVKNMSAPGARSEANVECWCELDLKDKLSKYGCCEGAYSNLCKAICPAQLGSNCSTAEALTCREKCPALCYEKDYAPSFCDTGCIGCEAYVLCTFNHSKNQMAAGHEDHAPICSDTAFYSSQEWKDWFKCYSKYPKRTHWQRYNAENYCYCQSNLTAAAERHFCCKAGWGKTICDEDCKASNQPVPGCDSTEAQTCLNDCKQTCSKIYKSQMTTECNDKCMAKTATCEKYRVCEPPGPFTFDYVCDDGSSPDTRGCCRSQFGNPTCPALCQSATGHHPKLEAMNIVFTNVAMECSCEGCPKTVAETKTTYKTTLEDNLFDTGSLEVAKIARDLGMSGPNEGMNRLLQERNSKITAAFDALPSWPDNSWQAQMDGIMAEYSQKFLAEGQRYVREGDTTQAPVTVKQESSDDSNTTLIIVLASCGGLVAILLVAVVVLCLRNKSRRLPGGQRPRDGDPNVVMGRPVAPGSEAAAATEGAPVEIGDKGEDNNKL